MITFYEGLLQSVRTHGLQMAEVCLARHSPQAEGATGQLYGFPADIWAVGVLACELLMGASPFEGDTKEETYASTLR